MADEIIRRLERELAVAASYDKVVTKRAIATFRRYGLEDKANNLENSVNSEYRSRIDQFGRLAQIREIHRQTNQWFRPYRCRDLNSLLLASIISVPFVYLSIDYLVNTNIRIEVLELLSMSVVVASFMAYALSSAILLQEFKIRKQENLADRDLSHSLRRIYAESEQYNLDV